jgi:7,8-dihydroneopterin aldolase/epimerase/oxygenase
MKSGIVGVRGHRVRCWVGTEPHEKVHPQELLFDIDVRYPFEDAIASDAIEKGVSYVALADLVTKTAESGHIHLIERLASMIIDRVLKQFPMVEWVRVRIEKPQAIPTASYAFAELETRQ